MHEPHEPVLEGKVAVVTGAGRGIGLASARRFAQEGATVVVSDRDAASTDEGAQALGVDGIPCDVRDELSVARLLDSVRERHGRLDVVMANAGVLQVAPLTQTTAEQWDALMSVNSRGTFATLRAAATAMVESGEGGSIILTASIAARGGWPMAGAYAASKAGVQSIARTAAIELRPHGIRVNAICPGFVQTEMIDDAAAAYRNDLGVDMGETVLALQGRFGHPDEIAAVAAFLASERSSLCSGSAWVIDATATASIL